MAKKKTATATTRSVVVREKAAPITIRMPAAPKPAKKTSKRRSIAGGSNSGHNIELTAAAGGYVLALIDKSPMAASIPAAPVIGRHGTVALLAWWWGKTNPTVRRLSWGMLGVAGFELGGGTITQTTQGVSGYVPGTAAAF